MPNPSSKRLLVDGDDLCGLGKHHYMIGTDRLLVLVTVARTGSFAAAAAALHLTPSAVSQQVAALERHVGVQLFERSRHGAQLTELGRVLLPHAEAVLTQLHDAETELGFLVSGEHGHIALGSFPTATASFVATVIADLGRTHPGISIRLVDGEPADSYRRLLARELDLAVVFDLESWPMSRTYEGTDLGDPDEVATVDVCSDPLLLLLPAAHHLAGRREVPIEALAGEAFMGSSNDCAPWGDDFRRRCREAGFVPDFQPMYSSVDFRALQGLVAAGLGLTLLPDLAASVLRPDLVVRPLIGGDLVRRVKVAFPRRAYRPPGALAIVEALRAAVASRTPG